MVRIRIGRVIIAFTVATGWLCAPPQTDAADDAQKPRAVVQRVIDSIRALGTVTEPKQRAQMVESINQSLAIASLSRQALGSTWNRLDKAERTRFAALMTETLKKVAYPRAVEFFAGLEIDYRGEEASRQGTIVKTSVTRLNSGQVEIDYIMERINGRWRIADISLDGESLSHGVTQQIQNQLKQGSYDDLVMRIRSRLKQVTDAQHSRFGTAQESIIGGLAGGYVDLTDRLV